MTIKNALNMEDKLLYEFRRIVYEHNYVIYRQLCPDKNERFVVRHTGLPKTEGYKWRETYHDTFRDVVTLLDIEIEDKSDEMIAWIENFWSENFGKPFFGRAYD